MVGVNGTGLQAGNGSGGPVRTGGPPYRRCGNWRGSYTRSLQAPFYVYAKAVDEG
jgi:hypothetical protein